jgi:hypothetical protein
MASRPTSTVLLAANLSPTPQERVKGYASDADLQAKYELTSTELNDIAQKPAVAKAIRSERERRIYNGTAARELASTQYATALRVLGEILNDKTASPRHRIESSRELRASAAGVAGTENITNNAERFMIVISLGADTLKFEGDVAPMKPAPLTIEDKSDGEE